MDSVPSRALKLTGKHTRIEEFSHADEVILVKEGFVAKYRVTASGKRQILGFGQPGDLLASRGQSRRYKITALGECVLILFPSAKFDEYLSASPELSRFVTDALCRELLACQEWLMSVASSPAEDRIVRVICELGERMGLENEATPFPLSQQQMADATGQTAVNVNRVLANLEEKGLVTRSGRLVVDDWVGLRRMIAFDRSYLSCCT